MFDIMSQHWDFLELFQQHADFSKFDLDHLRPAFVCKQYDRFFEYIDSLPNDIKTEYFNSFGKLASLDDSKAFRKLVCKDENIELLGNYNVYRHVKEQLWEDDRADKMLFTKAWNKRWKEELKEE